MKVLGLDFSSPQRSVALLDWEEGRAQILAESVERDYRKTTALAQMEELLRSFGISPQAIECIAVGLGPGSYTGIRSALAIAQGWQIAREVMVCGASSSEAIALAAARSGARGEAQVVVDAQRSELYVEDYQLETEPKVLRPMRIEPQELWQSHKAPTIIGPEVEKWEPSGLVVFPAGAAIVDLALKNGRFVPAESLEPIYLRQSTFVKAAPPRTGKY
jgi:tRNA threonylcarbamoyl adenosine modification protein YeaZ